MKVSVVHGCDHSINSTHGFLSVEVLVYAWAM